MLKPVARIGALGAPDATKRLLNESLRSPYFHLRQGDAALARGERQAAEQAYRSALQRDPFFVPALIQLGQLALQANNTQEAIELYQRAVDADGASSSARNNMGAALMSAGRAEEALRRFQEALGRDPDNCGARFNKAAALDKLGRSRQAAQAWADYLRGCGDRAEEASAVKIARKRLEELR